MTQNENVRVGRKELKVAAALMVVITATYGSAIAVYNFGYWPGAAGAFVALLASMYLLSQVMVVDES